MTLYEKILERKKKNIGTIQASFEETILSQLLLTALYNDLCPGELPDEFEIKNIICTKESF